MWTPNQDCPNEYLAASNVAHISRGSISAGCSRNRRLLRSWFIPLKLTHKCSTFIDRMLHLYIKVILVVIGAQKNHEILPGMVLYSLHSKGTHNTSQTCLGLPRFIESIETGEAPSLSFSSKVAAHVAEAVTCTEVLSFAKEQQKSISSPQLPGSNSKSKGSRNSLFYLNQGRTHQGFNCLLDLMTGQIDTARPAYFTSLANDSSPL